jgi:anti-sigma B factor antagonist
VTIVDVVGEMSLPYIKLRSVITTAIERGRKHLVLNLEGASYIDSMWLGAIVSDFTKLRQLGGQLKLLNPPASILKLFTITKLSLIFDIFTSEEDAVNSFFADRVLLYPRALAQEAIPTEHQPRLRPPFWFSYAIPRTTKLLCGRFTIG